MICCSGTIRKSDTNAGYEDKENPYFMQPLF